MTDKFRVISEVKGQKIRARRKEVGRKDRKKEIGPAGERASIQLCYFLSVGGCKNLVHPFALFTYSLALLLSSPSLSSLLKRSSREEQALPRGKNSLVESRKMLVGVLTLKQIDRRQFNLDHSFHSFVRSSVRSIGFVFDFDWTFIVHSFD